MKWCCESFQNSFNNKNNRGFAYIIEKLTSDDELYFFIQFRAVEEGKQQELKSNTPVSIEGKECIWFCPNCGKNLKKFYKKSMKEMVAQNE